MTALRAGWRSFWARPDAVLVPVLVGALAWTVAEFFVQAVISGTVTRSHSCLRHVAGMTDLNRCAAGAHAHTAAAVLGLFAFLVLGLIFWGVLAGAGLAALGTPVRRRPGPVLLAAVLGGLGVSLGITAGVLPGIVLLYLAQFTMIAIVADELDPFRAFGRSVALVVRRPVVVFGFAVLATVVLGAGLLLGIVGLFPASAIVLLAQLHLYRSLSAGPVGVEPEHRPGQ